MRCGTKGTYSTPTATNQRPNSKGSASATDAQLKFISDLLDQKDAWLSPAWLAVASAPGDISKKTASLLISTLKGMPDKAGAAAAPGYYVRNGEVYVVVLNRAGTNTYAKQMVISNGRGRWEYAKGVGRDIAKEGLAPLTVTEAARLGKLHGACVDVNREGDNYGARLRGRGVHEPLGPS